ncbi:MAG: AAA family ATPase [Caldilineaceae bacterium]
MLPRPRTTYLQEKLIGRQTEWQIVLAAWRLVAGGRTHFLVIEGEAGIGKTRLAEEFVTWANRQGIRAAHTRAYAAEGALAYAPVAEWLRTDAVRAGWLGLETVWLTELAHILPEVLVEHPGLPVPQPLRESWQRKRLFEALARATLADKHPLLLVLDDLQWCDRETLEWLHYLLRYAPRTPLLVVGTVRPEEVESDHPLTSLLLELRGAAQVTELALGPLTLDETATLATQVTSQPLPPDAIQRLYRETEGNPLFVVETARTELSRAVGEVMDRGGLSSSPPLLDSPNPLPPKVYAIIQRRLAQLSSPARELASLAAVIGRSFAFQVVAQASDQREDMLMRGLDELWQRRIIREQGLAAYDFSHDRIREVAYADVGPARRRLLHHRVAQALEAIHAANLEPVNGQVAVHYEQAGLWEQAIHYYQQAAETARRICAYNDSVHSLNRGLALIATLPVTVEQQRKELMLLLALGAVLSAIKGKAALEVREVYTQALALCWPLDDKFSMFVVQQELRIFYGHRGTWLKARQLAEENLALAEELDDLELLQYAHLGIGLVLHHTGELLLAQVHLQQAIHQPLAQKNRFNQLFFDDARQGSLRNSAVTLWLLGYPDQARAQIDEALTLGRNEAQIIRFVMTLRFAAMLHHCLREVHMVQRWSVEMETLCVKYGFSHYLAVAALQNGWVLATQGEVATGIPQLQNTLVAQTATGRRLLLTYELALLVEAHWMAGQYSEGLAICHEALAVVEKTGECFWQAELLRLQSELLLAHGATLDEVEAGYWQAIAIARQQNAKSLELRATMSLARLWQKQGKPIEAHQMLSTIYDWFTEGFDTPDLQAAKVLLQKLA